MMHFQHAYKRKQHVKQNEIFQNRGTQAGRKRDANGTHKNAYKREQRVEKRKHSKNAYKREQNVEKKETFQKRL